MAEKKTGKKFVQKPKFRNEKKYKTDKTEVKKYNTFGKKKAEKKIVVKSEKSLCPVHGKCGGCQLLDMPYEKQLKQKQKQVNKLLKPYCNTEKIIGMENPFHYRNKVHACLLYTSPCVSCVGRNIFSGITDCGWPYQKGQICIQSFASEYYLPSGG